MFATGIENSIPTINQGKTRVDQMHASNHYERWREDFDCVQEIGINYLRYGPPLYKCYLAPGKYDWEFPDLTFADLKRQLDLKLVELKATNAAFQKAKAERDRALTELEQKDKHLVSGFPWRG